MTCLDQVRFVSFKKGWLLGSFENEALENEDRSTKHPNLENEAFEIFRTEKRFKIANKGHLQISVVKGGSVA